MAKRYLVSIRRVSLSKEWYLSQFSNDPIKTEDCPVSCVVAAEFKWLWLAKAYANIIAQRFENMNPSRVDVWDQESGQRMAHYQYEPGFPGS